MIGQFSEKQRLVLTWWGRASPYRDLDAIICDGAVRSGKTLALGLSFVLWAMSRFQGQQFALCGKTTESVRRNLLTGVLPVLEELGFTWEEKVSRNWLKLRLGRRENTFYLFGGKDEASFMLIQGRTLAGVFLDEVALMPRSFVEQALARCSVSGSRFWFNCNPGAPGHWFYTEWIQQAKARNALHLHFELEDNPSLTPDIVEGYHSMYTGVFYKRYIRGLWVAADGAVYPEFADDKERYIIDEAPTIVQAVIGVDFGGTGSAHSFTLTGFTSGYRDVVLLDEYYHDNRKQGILSPAQLDAAFVDFVRRAQSRYRVMEAYCDSAEQTLIRGLSVAAMRERVPISIRNAHKGPINDRIAFYNSMMAQGRFKVMRHCTAAIDALSTAVYDSKKPGQDVRLDDGTTNIDSLDSLEYSTESVQKDILYLGVRR